MIYFIGVIFSFVLYLVCVIFINKQILIGDILKLLVLSISSWVGAVMILISLINSINFDVFTKDILDITIFKSKKKDSDYEY